MYNVHLTRSLLCFEFVELTLFYNKVFFSGDYLDMDEPDITSTKITLCFSDVSNNSIEKQPGGLIISHQAVRINVIVFIY